MTEDEDAKLPMTTSNPPSSNASSTSNPVSNPADGVSTTATSTSDPKPGGDKDNAASQDGFFMTPQNSVNEDGTAFEERGTTVAATVPAPEESGTTANGSEESGTASATPPQPRRSPRRAKRPAVRRPHGTAATRMALRKKKPKPSP